MGLFSVTYTRDKRGTRSKDQGFVFVINLGGGGRQQGGKAQTNQNLQGSYKCKMQLTFNIFISLG